MKTIWNNFKVAFAMYSKIPMPPADWEKENMKYALCFFPWVGLAVGAVSAVLFWLLQQIGAGSMLRAAVLTAVPVLVTVSCSTPQKTARKIANSRDQASQRRSRISSGTLRNCIRKVESA